AAIDSPAVAWNNMGAIHMARGDSSEAAVAFERALKIDPGYTRAANNLTEARGALPAPVLVTLPPRLNDAGLPPSIESVSAEAPPAEGEIETVEILVKPAAASIPAAAAIARPRGR